jgi:hypothetical protein
MLSLLAWISLAVALLSAVVIAVDLARGHRQHMTIMNLVWPVTRLWAGPLAVWAYFEYGRAGDEKAFLAARKNQLPPPNTQQPFGVLAAKATTHCGSGCTLGDIAAELFTLVAPLASA